MTKPPTSLGGLDAPTMTIAKQRIRNINDGCARIILEQTRCGLTVIPETDPSMPRIIVVGQLPRQILKHHQRRGSARTAV